MLTVLLATPTVFGDMTLEVKYKFAELAGFALAIKPSVIMPTGKCNNGLSEGRWQFGSTLIATKEFADGAYALHANLGYEYHHYREDDGSQRRNLWSGSIAGEAEIARACLQWLILVLPTRTKPQTNCRSMP